MITLRGFARRPPMPTFAEVYRLRAGAIAVYPMYRGLARLVGMAILPAGTSWAEQVERLGRTGPTTTSSSCTTSIPMPRARTATSRARSSASRNSTPRSPSHGAPARRGRRDRRPQHAGGYRSHSWHPVPVVLVASTCRPDAATASASTSACAADWPVRGQVPDAARAGPRRPARQIRRVSGWLTSSRAFTNGGAAGGTIGRRAVGTLRSPSA